MQKYLSIIFIFIYINLTAQIDLKYSILSINNQTPISGAYVCFNKIDFEKVCFTSDDEGKIYGNITQGIYTVDILKEGFEHYQEIVKVDDSTDKVFYVWENSIELAPIVIDVRRSNLNRSFGTTTLKIDGTPFFQNASFEDIVRIIPEVSLNNDRISILGKNRVLYLINGRETTRNINQLQANQIDKIEVVSNPSAKYQASYDAVINIILKKNENRGLFLNLNSNTYINRKNSFHNSIDVGLNLGKLNIESNFKYNFDNGLVYDNGWQDYYDKFETYFKKYNSKKEYLETSTNINYELNDQNDIGANFTFGRNPKNNTQSNTDSKFYDLNNVQDSIVNSINEQIAEVEFYNLNFYHSLNTEKQNLSTYFSLISSDNILDNNINSFNSNVNTLNQNVLSNNKNKTYILNSDYEHNFEKDKLEFGVRFSKFDGKYSLLNQNFSNTVSDLLFDFNEDIIASYAVYKFKKGKFDFSTGLRYEYFTRNVEFNNTERYNTNQGNFFPSLNIGFKSENQTNSVDFSYSKKIQRPSFSDITPFEYNVSYNTIFRGNPYLKNEIIHSLQIVYIYNKSFYVIPYFNYSSDFVEQISFFENNNIIWIPVNYDAQTYGGNIGYNTSLFNKKLLLYNRLTLENTTNKGNVNGLDFNKSLFQYSLYFAQVYNISKKTSITVISNYYSPQLSDFYEITQGFRTDFRISSKFFNNKLEGSVRVNDIFNTYYNKLTGNVDGIRSYRYSDFSTRSISFSLRYYFNTGKKGKSNPVEIDNSDEENRITN